VNDAIVNEILNPIAERENPDSGLYCTPEEGKLYPIAHFYCIDEGCHDPQRRLFLKKSKLGRYFYSHFGSYQHDISPETLLHKLTIKSFERLTEFQLPSFKDDQSNFYPDQVFFIDPEKTVVEFRGLKGVRPDVTLESTSGMKLAVEVFVTNRTKEQKIQRLNDHKLPTIELNLNDFYLRNREQCKTDIIFIKENALILIAELRRKKWLQHANVDQVIGLMVGEEPKTKIEPSTRNSPSQGCLVFFVIPVLLGLFWLFK
jgi:hypothetical protein